MSNFIKMSEAASLAFHTAAYLAQNPDSARSEPGDRTILGASEHHLSKVLQRLVHSGIVRSTRGPRGGFMIRAPREKIKLIDIYESIEGPMQPARCLLGLPICKGNRCPLGALIHKTDEAVRKCLSALAGGNGPGFRPGA